MRPESLSKNSLEIEVEKELIDDPQLLTETFNDFFVEKPNKLASGIKKPAFQYIGPDLDAIGKYFTTLCRHVSCHKNFAFFF